MSRSSWKDAALVSQVELNGFLTVLDCQVLLTRPVLAGMVAAPGWIVVPTAARRIL